MRGKRARQICQAVLRITIGWSDEETKKEIRRTKRKYNAKRRGSQSSKPVTKGLFCCRVGRENTKGEGDRR